MDIALSLRYGGMPVSASECNYGDYYRLQLVCPACYAPVHKVAAKTVEQTTRRIFDKTTGEQIRTVDVQGYQARSHFAHPPNKSKAEVDLCEQRVSSLSRSQIAKKIREARGQRERIFKKHFWDILTDCFLMGSWEQDAEFAETGFLAACPVTDPPNLRQHKWKLCKESFVSRFRSNTSLAYCEGLMTETLQNIRTDIDAVGDQWFTNFDPITAQCLQRAQENLEAQMQLAIAKEALHFLCNKRNQDIIETLFAIGLASWSIHQDSNDYAEGLLNSNLIGTEEQLRVSLTNVVQRYEAFQRADARQQAHIVAWISSRIALILLLTPWADSFERLDKKLEKVNQTPAIVLDKGIWHLTANTGHLAFQPFSRAKNNPFLGWMPELKQNSTLERRLKIPYQDYSVSVTIDHSLPGAALFDLFRHVEDDKKIIILTSVVVWREDSRDTIEKMFHQTYESTIQPLWLRYTGEKGKPLEFPKRLPHLTVALTPGIAVVEEASWLGDFEACLSQALIFSDLYN